MPERKENAWIKCFLEVQQNIGIFFFLFPFPYFNFQNIPFSNTQRFCFQELNHASTFVCLGEQKKKGRKKLLSTDKIKLRQTTEIFFFVCFVIVTQHNLCSTTFSCHCAVFLFLCNFYSRNTCLHGSTNCCFDKKCLEHF